MKRRDFLKLSTAVALWPSMAFPPTPKFLEFHKVTEVMSLEAPGTLIEDVHVSSAITESGEPGFGSLEFWMKPKDGRWRNVIAVIHDPPPKPWTVGSLLRSASRIYQAEART